MAAQAQIEAQKAGQTWLPPVIRIFPQLSEETLDEIYFELSYSPVLGGGLDFSLAEIDSLTIGKAFEIYDKLINRRNKEQKNWAKFFGKINGAEVK